MFRCLPLHFVILGVVPVQMHMHTPRALLNRSSQDPALFRLRQHLPMSFSQIHLSTNLGRFALVPPLKVNVRAEGQHPRRVAGAQVGPMTRSLNPSPTLACLLVLLPRRDVEKYTVIKKRKRLLQREMAQSRAHALPLAFDRVPQAIRTRELECKVRHRGCQSH